MKPSLESVIQKKHQRTKSKWQNSMKSRPESMDNFNALDVINLYLNENRKKLFKSKSLNRKDSKKTIRDFILNENSIITSHMSHFNTLTSSPPYSKYKCTFPSLTTTTIDRDSLGKEIANIKATLLKKYKGKTLIHQRRQIQPEEKLLFSNKIKSREKYGKSISARYPWTFQTFMQNPNWKSIYSKTLTAERKHSAVQSEVSEVSEDMSGVPNVPNKRKKNQDIKMKHKQHNENNSIISIVNNVNPAKNDKKVEINFNQYEIKIVPQIEKDNTNMVEDRVNENILNGTKLSHSASNKRRSHSNIVLHQGLPKKIVLNLPKFSQLKIQKAKDNININFGSNKDKEVKDGTDEGTKEPIVPSQNLNLPTTPIKPPFIRKSTNKKSKTILITDIKEHLKNLSNTKVGTSNRRLDRARTMKYEQGIKDLNISLPEESYSFADSNSTPSLKRNKTINEDFISMNDSSIGFSDSPNEDEKLSKRKGTMTGILNNGLFPNKGQSLGNLGNFHGFKRKNSRTLSSNEPLIPPERLEKLVSYMGENEEKLNQIEETCSSRKMEFRDWAMNFIFISKLHSIFESPARPRLLPKGSVSFIENSTMFSKTEYLLQDYKIPSGSIKSHSNCDSIFYLNLILLKYFDFNLAPKIFKECYHLNDFRPDYFTLYQNFDKSEKNQLHARLNFRQNNLIAHMATCADINDQQCNQQFPFLPICFELGFDNMEYCNRYLNLDIMNSDGTNQLSSVFNTCDVEKNNFQVEVKPSFNIRTPVKSDKEEQHFSASSEGGMMSPLFQRKQVLQTLSLLNREKESRRNMNMNMNTSGQWKKMQTMFSFKKAPSSGAVFKRLSFEYKIEKEMKNESLCKFMKMSILKQPFFSRQIDKEANNVYLNIGRRLQQLKQLMSKQKSSMLVTNCKAQKAHIRKNDRNTSQTKQMTKDSMLFRTLEIKSQILGQFSRLKDSLFFFIKDENFNQLKEIMEKYKVHVELTDNDGNSLLNLAVQCNSFNIVEFLLNLGADVNSQNKLLNTPLHYSLKNKNFQITDFLMERGADESIKNIFGLTPWQYMSSSNIEPY